MILMSFISRIKELDTKLLLAINGAHSDFLDVLMYGISNKYTWIPLYLLILWLVWKHYGKKGLWVVAAFALAVTLADQLSVHLFKNVFQRYRPCHNFDLQGLLHLVKGKCGGKFGFISSHACNTAAVATVGIFFFRKHVKWLVWLLFAYALLNSYSRVYMGVHYPSDVAVGALTGVVIGLLATIFVMYAGKLKKSIIAASVVLIIPFSSFSQTYGCTDPLALNYDSSATQNDGSCLYETVFISPVSSVEIPPVMSETSGLIFWDNRFWTHNDDTDINLYAFSNTNPDVFTTYPLTGLVNIDWEEITHDSNYVYVADVGNNSNGNRTNLRIFKIEKNSLLNQTPIIDTISFYYSDQTDFSETGANNTDFDCEAFILSGDSIFLFTKQWVSQKTKVYALPNVPGTHEALFCEEYNVSGLITGACYNEEKSVLVLCGYSILLQPFLYVLYDFGNNNFFNGNKRKVQLQLAFHQIEAIASVDFHEFYLTNEYFSYGTISTSQKMHKIDLSQLLSLYLGTNHVNNEVEPVTEIRVYPNPASDTINIVFSTEHMAVEKYEMFDLHGRLLSKGVLQGNRVDVSALPGGMYILTLEIAGARHSVKWEKE